MNRRSALRTLLHTLTVWGGAVAAVAFSARPANAYFFFFQYRFHYCAHRNRRRVRRRGR